jgi:hypothetical protein
MLINWIDIKDFSVKNGDAGRRDVIFANLLHDMAPRIQKKHKCKVSNSGTFCKAFDFFVSKWSTFYYLLKTRKSLQRLNDYWIPQSRFSLPMANTYLHPSFIITLQ